MPLYLAGLKLYGIYDFIKNKPEANGYFLAYTEGFQAIFDFYHPVFSNDEEKKQLEAKVFFNFKTFLRKVQCKLLRISFTLIEINK